MELKKIQIEIAKHNLELIRDLKKMFKGRISTDDLDIIITLAQAKLIKMLEES